MRISKIRSASAPTTIQSIITSGNITEGEKKGKKTTQMKKAKSQMPHFHPREPTTDIAFSPSPQHRRHQQPYRIRHGRFAQSDQRHLGAALQPRAPGDDHFRCSYEEMCRGAYD